LDSLAFAAVLFAGRLPRRLEYGHQEWKRYLSATILIAVRPAIVGVAQLPFVCLPRSVACK
jgi:hypothetical protein